MAHNEQRRLGRERRTVAAMVTIYCRAQHDRGRALCDDCKALLEYALHRVDCCPFGVEKPTCADCSIHCYRPAMRDRVRQVMQYAGPRMILRHPILAIRHLLDKRRPVPSPNRDRSAARQTLRGSSLEDHPTRYAEDQREPSHGEFEQPHAPVVNDARLTPCQVEHVAVDPIDKIATEHADSEAEQRQRESENRPAD